MLKQMYLDGNLHMVLVVVIKEIHHLGY